MFTRPTGRTWLLPLGVLVVGLGVFAALRGLDEATRGAFVGDDTGRTTLSANAPVGVRDLFTLYGDDRPAIADLFAGRPDEADELIREYGVLAPRAWAALGDPGLEILEYADAMPNYVAYIGSAVAPRARAATEPVAAWLTRLAERDPAGADALFYTLTRLDEPQAELLGHYPQALPVLTVAPAHATTAIDRYGDAAVNLMLRFTPDSYADIARLLATDGDRVFAVRTAMTGAGTGELESRQDLIESFIARYFLEFGELADWLEPRVGVEKSVYVMSRNMDWFDYVRRTNGERMLRTGLQSLIDYGRSGDERNEAIAGTTLTIPGGLPLFVEGAGAREARDSFIAEWGDRGGIPLLAQGYAAAREHWPELLEAVQARGDEAMVTLAKLVEHPGMLHAMDVVAADGEHTMTDLLRTVAAALQADGGTEARSFTVVDRTLQMVRNGHWEDTPGQERSFVWDLLPGYDAFRVARMMLRGYSPTMMEAINGAWDAVNVCTFAYRAGGAVINCTRAIGEALAQESFPALGRALGVVARHAVGTVFERFVEAISHPRNYIRLAVTAGYFAYDAFLTYAPLEIPNRARLIEINQRYLTPHMKGMLLDVLRDVTVRALVTPPSEDGELPVPGEVQVAVGDAKDIVAEADRVSFELERLDRSVRDAFVKLLDENARRRRFMRLIGMAQEMAPGDREPEAPRHYDPLDPDNESEEIALRHTGEVPAAVVVVGDQRIPLTAPRFRNLTPATPHTSPITGRQTTIPRDAGTWQQMVHNDPQLVAFCLEQIVDLITG